MPIDALDLKLIRCLQDNPRAPYSTVARLTGVSETTVKRRVDDLIADQIIRPVMVANMYRLGYRTRAFIGLKVDLRQMMNIVTQLRSYPETTSVTITAGRHNVTCFVVLQTLDSLTRFMLERIAPLDGILDTEITVVPRVVKVFADWKVPEDAFIEDEDVSSEDDTLVTSDGVWNLPPDSGI